ncbi:PAS domain-containing protein, partial [Mycobacterium tuberculosis]|nr:PAS domain-containing protein [Mycobacterium tuberculosis]
VLEVAEARNYRFRLAGTRVCALYGRELKGRDFSTLWTGKDRETIASLLGAITEEAAAVVVGFNGTTDFGRSVAVECLLLPVRQAGPGYQRVLGSVVAMEG